VLVSQQCYTFLFLHLSPCSSQNVFYFILSMCCNFNVFFLSTYSIKFKGVLDSDQKLKLAFSKGPNRLRVSHSSPEDGNRSSFRYVFSSFLEFRTLGKVQKGTIILRDIFILYIDICQIFKCVNLFHYVVVYTLVTLTYFLSTPMTSFYYLTFFYQTVLVLNFIL
jgi:hypothetical protein